MRQSLRSLYKQQVADWPLAKTNYDSLKQALVKSIDVNGFRMIVQHNPARILSCTASTDAKEIAARPCFLCKENRFPQQKGINVMTQSQHEYILLFNPFPVFSRHFTVTDSAHVPQAIEGRIDDMLELADKLTGYFLFYNGPQSGASAPDHFHFQAARKGEMPFQTRMDFFLNHRSRRLVSDNPAVSVYTIPMWPARQIIFRSQDPAALADSFEFLMDRAYAIMELESEMKMNILCWKTGEDYTLVVFPRSFTRPDCYFATGKKQFIVSPASVEMGGLIITPRKEDFDKITDTTIAHILSEVSLSESLFNSLIR